MAPQSNKRRQAKDEKFGELSVILRLLLLLLCTLASNVLAELQRYMLWEKVTVMLNMPFKAVFFGSGFGGRKRQMKSNDASSAADMDSYKPGSFSFGRGGDRGGSRGRGGRGGRGGGRGTGRGGFDGGSRGGRGDSRGRRGRFGAVSKGRGGANRPGKARRAAARG